MARFLGHPVEWHKTDYNRAFTCEHLIHRDMCWPTDVGKLHFYMLQRLGFPLEQCVTTSLMRPLNPEPLPTIFSCWGVDINFAKVPSSASCFFIVLLLNTFSFIRPFGTQVCWYSFNMHYNHITC